MAKTRRTVLRQAVADMRLIWCPVTANLPTRMTEAGFVAACKGYQVMANKRHGIAQFKQKKYAACLECMGKTRPRGLQIIQIEDFEHKEEQVASIKVIGSCEVCGKKRVKVAANHGVHVCSACMNLQSHVSKRPEIVAAEMERLHPGQYFPEPVTMAPVDDLFAVQVLADIREALGVGMGPMVSDLPGLVAAAVEKNETMRNDVEAQAAIIADLSEADQLYTDLSETGARIVSQCDRIKKTLLEKNLAYGDSAMNPVRIFSDAGPAEQLLVRIDDKISRLARGTEFQGDDTVMDLAGYLVLLLVSRDREEGKGKRKKERRNADAA